MTNRVTTQRLAAIVPLFLALTAPAYAAHLTPIPAQTLTFAAGRGMQPVTFSPGGQQLLTLDAAGLTLWQVDTLRPVWRSVVKLKWFPVAADWQADKITLSNSAGEQVSLSRKGGQELGRSQRTVPAEVQKAFGLPPAGKLRQIGRGIWQENPAQGAPFELMGGKLLGFYAQQGGQLALKRPNYAPLELWSGGKLAQKLDTIFPARGQQGLDTRFTENLSFSPDGRWLAWSANRRVTIWDARSGQKVAVLRPDPYAKDFEQLQAVWSPESDTLTVYSMYAMWRYKVDGFTLLGKTPAPEGALIRMASSKGKMASGTASALLISDASAVQTLGPVPEKVFYAEDGQVIAVSRPTLWIFHSKTTEPLTLRLPDYAETALVTLKGKELTVYGRDLSWQPGTEPKMTASIWTADLSGVKDGQMLDLALKQADERPNCGKEAGQWLTSLLRPVRLCQEGKQLSGYLASKQVWTVDIQGDGQPLVSEDGRWFALQNSGTARFYRSETGELLRAIKLPALPKNTYWSPTLRVDETGTWAALQAGQEWYLLNLKTGEVQSAPELQRADDVAFVAGQVAAVRADRVLWFALKS